MTIKLDHKLCYYISDIKKTKNTFYEFFLFDKWGASICFLFYSISQRSG